MLARTFILSAAFSTAAVGLFPLPPAVGQEQSQPDADNSKYRFAGVINADAVYVRSGAGESNYPTTKLDKGTEVTIVGIKNDWLKIVPPEGSYGLAPKVYVEKQGDGSVGRITQADRMIRIGSELVPSKSAVLTSLNEGDEVAIIGEVDEYFKIKPPEGSFLYVHKNYVDPVKVLGAGDDNTRSENLSGEQVDSNTGMVEQTPAVDADDLAANPTTRESGLPDASADSPTTQASEPATVAVEFDKLEADFKAATGQPIEQQPVAELLSGYEAMANSDQLPESMRRIADYRIASLKVRAESQAQAIEVRDMQEKMQQRQLALKAEREEIQERIQQNDVKIFTAVGTLQTSSLQAGAPPLYRLTDPATGRTMVYLRSDDTKIAGLLGQFIGVRGDVVDEQRLNIKVITPAAMETVDPSKVNNGVVAEIIPPSLLAQTPPPSREN